MIGNTSERAGGVGGAVTDNARSSAQVLIGPWFLASNKSNGIARNAKRQDRRGDVLFINARKLGHMVDRTRKEFSDEDIKKIADTYHAWRGESDAGAYQDVPGFCKSASLEEIKGHGYVLTPGRYVGAAETADDDVPFAERFQDLRMKLIAQFSDAEKQASIVTDKLALISS